jgi:Mrp family chromosome partitioning ATPase
MSRVADAVERAALVSAESSFRDDDHPWGSGLDARADAPDALTDATPFEPPHVVAPINVVAPITRPSSRSLPRDPREAIAPPEPLAVDESYRQHLSALVERIFLPVSVERPRSVAVSGVGTSSSTITAAVAQLVAAQTSASVCMVDADFDAPSLHTHFGVPHTTGLSDQIAAGEPLFDAAREVQRNLWLLTAGTCPTRPTFASDGARVRLAQLVARFDAVLIDIGPTSASSDAAGIAPLVDGVILVLSAEETRRESARRATLALQGLGATVLGAVLTDRRFPIPDPIYRRL